MNRLYEEEPRDNDTILEFLSNIFGPSALGYLSIWEKQTKRTTWFPAKGLAEATQRILELSKTNDVYFAAGLQSNDLGPKKRGGKETVCAIGGIWADLDVQDPNHKKGELPSSTEDALDFIDSLIWEPTIIVQSGHGLHVWWLFKELWEFKNPEEGEHAQKLLQNFQTNILKLGQERGWKFDNVSDLSRLMRIPGTWNRKGNPVPVFILKKNLSLRYTPEDILQNFSNQEITKISNKTNSKRIVEFSGSDQCSNYHDIIQECPFLKHCEEDVYSLSEPEWYAAISIVARCIDGETHAHDLSSSHPTYSRKETGEKIQHALKAAGPRTCKKIHEITGGEFCESCLYWDQIKSPIVLGKPESLWKIKKIQHFNENHAIVRIGGKSLILNEDVDPNTRWRSISFSSERDFLLWYGNYKNPYTKNGPTPPRLWLNSPHRRQFQGIGFNPKTSTPGIYNLWQGFSFKPIPGDCHLFLKHIEDNIANGNEEVYQYLMAWMASAIQFPEERIGVAIVLRGKQGTGKGIFATQFGKLFGPHFLHIQHSRHLVGNFNSHLKDSLLVFADEAFYAGDKASEGALKALITEERLPIEIKGKDVFYVQNYIRLIMASNHSWVVPAGLDDRRFFVLDVGDAYRCDQEYFRAIVDQMDNGGREALMHELLSLDISKMNLRKFPRTQAQLENKIHTMPASHQYLFHLLREGKLCFNAQQWDKQIDRKTFHNGYLQFASDLGQSRRSSETELGIALKKIIPGIRATSKTIHREKQNLYVFPPLEECRQAFHLAIDYPVKWPDENS